MKIKTMIAALVCVASFLCVSVQASPLQKESECTKTTPVAKRKNALRDSILANISGAKIAAKTLFIKDFGARNDGKTDCRAAFAKAIRKAAAMNGGKVVVPSGVYYVKGPLYCRAMCASNCRRGQPSSLTPTQNTIP